MCWCGCTELGACEQTTIVVVGCARGGSREGYSSFEFELCPNFAKTSRAKSSELIGCCKRSVPTQLTSPALYTPQTRLDLPQLSIPHNASCAAIKGQVSPHHQQDTLQQQQCWQPSSFSQAASCAASVCRWRRGER